MYTHRRAVCERVCKYVGFDFDSCICMYMSMCMYKCSAFIHTIIPTIRTSLGHLVLGAIFAILLDNWFRGHFYSLVIVHFLWFSSLLNWNTMELWRTDTSIIITSNKIFILVDNMDHCSYAFAFKINRYQLSQLNSIGCSYLWKYFCEHLPCLYKGCKWKLFIYF